MDKKPTDFLAVKYICDGHMREDGEYTPVEYSTSTIYYSAYNSLKVSEGIDKEVTIEDILKKVEEMIREKYGDNERVEDIIAEVRKGNPNVDTLLKELEKSEKTSVISTSEKPPQISFSKIAVHSIRPDKSEKLFKGNPGLRNYFDNQLFDLSPYYNEIAICLFIGGCISISDCELLQADRLITEETLNRIRELDKKINPEEGKPLTDEQLNIRRILSYPDVNRAICIPIDLGNGNTVVHNLQFIRLNSTYFGETDGFSQEDYEYLIKNLIPEGMPDHIELIRKPPVNKEI